MRRFLILMLLFMLPAAVLADPLLMAEDLSGSVSEPFYEYSYRYPRVDDSDPRAPYINNYYSSLVNEAVNEKVPSTADHYAGIGQHATLRIDYDITCSSDEFFSVRIHRTEETEDGIYETWQGETFSLTSGMPGQTCTISQILGMLDAGETDEYLQERHARKVHDAVCRLVWERILESADDIPYFEGLTKEMLDYVLIPEEQFWLDETGNPVFYILPGYLADPEAGELTFPVSIEDIDDEI